MPKFILRAVLLLIMLTACGRQNTEEIPSVPLNGNGEPIIMVEPSENTNAEQPPTLPIIEIPPFNDYIIDLEIDTENRTVQGISRIEFTNRTQEELYTIVFRVYLNAFRENMTPRPYFSDNEWRLSRRGWERGFGYMDIQYASINHQTVGFHIDNTVLTLHLSEAVKPEQTVQLLLQFNAYIPKIAHRTGGNEHAMWFGMFLPVLSVFDENGWNTEPLYPAGEPFYLETANYNVTITTPMRYTVVGTGLRTEEVIEDTDTRITRFTAQMVRDFAFALSPYFNHAQIATNSGIEIHLYYHTSSLQTEHILDTARISMEYFEEKVGAYPFGHVTIIETDLLAESTAFSQVVFVDTRHFLYNLHGNLWWLANGLGLQWFANVVGTNRVAEPWLDEGLTRFVQAGIFYNQTELRERIERERNSIIHRTDLYMTLNLSNFNNRAHYAYTHGRKAMVMLYALHHEMGDDNFWALISEYYYNFSFAIATANDFIRIAEEIHGSNLDYFFSKWMEVGYVPELPE